MDVLKPHTLTILEASVPEDPRPPWDKDASYLPADEDADPPREADEVIDNGYAYIATAPSTGVRPSESVGTVNSPWSLTGVTNRFAALDPYRSTQTIAQEGETELFIKVPFAPPATAIALLNMKAVTVTATVVTDKGEEAWTSGEVRLQVDVANWWEWCFLLPIAGREDILWRDIPPVKGTLSITLTGTRPAIGSIIVGRPRPLGPARYGTEVGNIDYSRIETDAHGNESWIKRRNAKRGLFPIWFRTSRLDAVRKTLADVAGTPSLWIGHDGFESMVMVGFAREDSSVVEGPEVCTATLDIRGIV